MTQHPNAPPPRQRRQLVLRIPYYGSDDEAAEDLMLRRNIGHQALAVPDNPTGKNSILFLRFILPDEVVEHVLLYLTAHCSQNSPRILRDTLPPDYNEYDGTLKAWFEGRGDPNDVA